MLFGILVDGSKKQMILDRRGRSVCFSAHRTPVLTRAPIKIISRSAAVAANNPVPTRVHLLQTDHNTPSNTSVSRSYTIILCAVSDAGAFPLAHIPHYVQDIGQRKGPDEVEQHAYLFVPAHPGRDVSSHPLVLQFTRPLELGANRQVCSSSCTEIDARKI